MKRLILFLVPLIAALPGFSQLKIKNKKYPSLLWEISGNGLKKPSYLFGTMHVSSKIAFHLSDSFYIGIRNADVVALETNPESWQEDMSDYEMGSFYRKGGGYPGLTDETPNQYLTIKTLQFGRYEKRLESALFIEPSVINNLLYRSYSDNSSDFEEDTFLDMYIYQVGKKLGKRVAGVEDYGESMKLMIEAYRDAAKDRNKKNRSYNYDIDVSPVKLQEAYRTGNLDLLDSINRLNSYSDAFDEKFLFRRNEIQAKSIDSILKRSTLFVGVGAAHLPGPRGVIEILRAMGYKLRPIFMETRDSKHKELVEKLRVPVSFSTQVAEDAMYKVDIPGKFYDFQEYGILDQRQYADMANGSYYMITRVRTDGLFWGHSTTEVARKIDSVLYENVPGKILSKTSITKNGYKGFDVTNRTRRGDYQRYNIFITPFEVLFFKMSGTNDYVKNGDEAKKFFGSIQLKEFRNGGWRKFQPTYGGFSVELPSDPLESFSNSVRYDAEDKATGTHFSVIRNDIHNYGFAEEDTFDLALMDESYASSEFIDKQISRQQVVHKGYPALECKYKHKDGSISSVRFLVRGPQYYTMVAHGPKENPSMSHFLNSFEIAPYVYKDMKEYVDTTLKYTVKTTWFPYRRESKLDMLGELGEEMEEEDEESITSVWSEDQSRLIKNDTTGEMILVTYTKTGRYYYSDDTTFGSNFEYDSTWILKSKKRTILKDGTNVWDAFFTDTNSSRVIRMKTFYMNGHGYHIMAEVDSIGKQSSFIINFFENFTPADSLKETDPFTKKSKIFFDDLLGTDSVLRNKAIRTIDNIYLDSTDFPSFKKAIASFNWSDKKYLDTKKNFIQNLWQIRTKDCSNYLKQLYQAAGDTVELQYAVLQALLWQKTQYSYNLFRDIITSDPPVLNVEGRSSSISRDFDYFGSRHNSYDNDSFLDNLYDSLQLTKTILPDLLPLMNLDDYEPGIMELLRTMVDSNLVKPDDYSIYFSKFLIEAKQEIKKQSIQEKTKAIEKAEEDKDDDKPDYNYFGSSRGDEGNEGLISYATLLLPFWDTNPNVAPLFKQLLSSSDRRLKYKTFMLLARNKKPVPDSMFNYYAGLDKYRFELYTDLRKLKLSHRFPSAQSDKISLAKSELVAQLMGEPDSLIFIEKKSTTVANKVGDIYFFKYKSGKSTRWNLAAVGLVNPARDQYLFEEDKTPVVSSPLIPDWQENMERSKFDFSNYSAVPLKQDEPVADQVNKLFKKMIYSKRKSGRMFYTNPGSRYDFMPPGVGED